MTTYNYRIEYDDSSFNPRDEFDNLSTFYGPKNTRYLVGGKHDYEVYDLEETIQQFRREKAVIVEFSSNAGTCYAVVERSQMQKEYLDYGYSMRKALAAARRVAEGEISEFLAWANGEVYGYIVYSDKDDHLDSCWGYYGDSGRDAAEEEAKSLVKWYEEQQQKEADELQRRIDEVSQ